MQSVACISADVWETPPPRYGVLVAVTVLPYKLPIPLGPCLDESESLPSNHPSYFLAFIVERGFLAYLIKYSPRAIIVTERGFPSFARDESLFTISLGSPFFVIFHLLSFGNRSYYCYRAGFVLRRYTGLRATNNPHQTTTNGHDVYEKPFFFESSLSLLSTDS